MTESIRTYQTRPELAQEQSGFLDAYASQYGLAERTLFARIEAGDDRNALKRDFLRRFGITARQFNAVQTGLGGKIASV
ncbi:MAG: hypothetical protein ABSA46_17740 [Thermodesulfovibrionales bacterium]|jgi:hypothetical protein